MALETGSYVSDLVATNPPGGDDVGQADDHLRLIKSCLKNSFPNIDAPMLASSEILSVLAVDVTPPGGDGYMLVYDAINTTVKWISSGAGGGTVPAHTHDAADIVAGVVNIARLPTGTGTGTVAFGDHTHAKFDNPLWVTGEISAGSAQQAGFGWASGASVAYVTSKVVNGDAALLTWTGSVSYAPVVADGATHGAILSHVGSTKLATSGTGITVNGRISGLTTPTSANDAATKGYVDTKEITQLKFSGQVRAEASGFGTAISGSVYPATNGGGDCGSSTLRWATVYAQNGTINTSDAREKRGIRPLTDSEMEASRRLAKIIRAWQWQDMLRDQKVHVGVIAQDVIAAMKQVNLDALSYGFIDSTGDRYGVNYGELAMFIAAGQEQRLEALERKLEY